MRCKILLPWMVFSISTLYCIPVASTVGENLAPLRVKINTTKVKQLWKVLVKVFCIEPVPDNQIHQSGRTQSLPIYLQRLFKIPVKSRKKKKLTHHRLDIRENVSVYMSMRNFIK